MIVIRTSTLERFRKVCETVYEPEAELVARITRGQWVNDPEVPWYMSAGTAWHKALADETPDDLSRIDEDGCVGYEGDGEIFYFDQDHVFEAIAHVGPGVHEMTGRAQFLDWRSVPVYLEGTTDHVLGLDLQDHKTKFSPADPDDYEDSLQWRAYLLIHGGRSLRYNLFEMADPKDGKVDLRNIYHFKVWPYEGMRRDVVRWLDRFLDWVETRNLARYLINDRSRK